MKNTQKYSPFYEGQPTTEQKSDRGVWTPEIKERMERLRESRQESVNRVRETKEKYEDN